jgi:integration host factor subunit beta
MNKSTLIEQLAGQLPHLTHNQVESIVNVMFDSMMEALRKGDKVEIRGFASFTIRSRRPKEGRNPKTGALVNVPAKKVPFFKAGRELKLMMNQAAGTPPPDEPDDEDEEEAEPQS